MEQIRIDDGSKTYEIVNQDDKPVGTFTFNPSDVRIVEKYNAVVDGLEETFRQLDAGGEDALIKVSDALKQKMDELFGYDTSAFWAACSPMSPLSTGELYIENVLSAVAAVIEKESDARLKKTRSKMKSYTDGYKK